jgi:cytochrome P450
MTVDIISEVAFGKSFQLLIKAKDNNFDTDFLKAFDLVAESIWDLMYLPVIRLMTNILPPAISARLSKPAAYLQDVLKAVKTTVEDFKALQTSDRKPEHEIVFERMTGLDNIQMHAEAMDILIAGSDTTATTLATAIEELARDPKILNKLKEELTQSGIRTGHYDITRLEQLPYLVCRSTCREVFPLI